MLQNSFFRNFQLCHSTIENRTAGLSAGCTVYSRGRDFYTFSLHASVNEEATWMLFIQAANLRKISSRFKICK